MNDGLLMLWKVHVGGRRWKRFATLTEARAFCSEVFDRTGIVLAIVAI
jgi:hypothetical protein